MQSLRRNIYAWYKGHCHVKGIERGQGLVDYSQVPCLHLKPSAFLGFLCFKLRFPLKFSILKTSVQMNPPPIPIMQNKFMSMAHAFATRVQGLEGGMARIADKPILQFQTRPCACLTCMYCATHGISQHMWWVRVHCNTHTLQVTPSSWEMDGEVSQSSHLETSQS